MKKQFKELECKTKKKLQRKFVQTVRRIHERMKFPSQKKKKKKRKEEKTKIKINIKKG